MEHVLHQRWLEIVRRHGSEPALTESGGRRWTFVQLHRAAEEMRMASDAMAFPSGRDAQFVLTTLAAWRAGAIVCPLDGPAPLALPPVDALRSRGICHLKLTSGTTASPKVVLFRGEQLAADCANICSTMGLRRETPNLGVISLAHSYGFSNLVLPLLLEGVPLILAPDPLPESVRAGMDRGGKVVLPAVPALWKAWHDAGILTSERIALAISAGAPLSANLEGEIFRSAGIKVHNFYGASECGGIAYDRSAAPRTDGRFAGQPMDNVRLWTDGEGFLIVESAAVASGRWPDDDAASAPIRGRNFHCSDLAVIDAGGVTLRGRSGDLINVAGRKLDPAQVEAVLEKHPEVACCVVFGVPSADAQRCEDVVAVCRLRDGAVLEHIRRHAAQALPAWQLPRHWWQCAELAPNQRGKLSRGQWRSRFLHDRSAAAAGAGDAEP